MRSRTPGTRWATALVSVAVLAALATLVLLGMVVVDLVTGRGAGTASGHGLGAAGTASFATGLLVLARAVAVARTGPRRGRKLCTRCAVGALAGSALVLVVGGVAVLLTRTGTPMGGAGAAAALLLPLSGLAARQRVSQRAWERRPPRARLQPTVWAEWPPPVVAPRSGGRRESEPGRAAGAR